MVEIMPEHLPVTPVVEVTTVNVTSQQKLLMPCKLYHVYQPNENAAEAACPISRSDKCSIDRLFLKPTGGTKNKPQDITLQKC